jgi:muramidase (phage lysozyme)
MIRITPEEYALLGAIASTEAPGYDVMYGHSWSGEDRRFTDFSDHPRQFFEITSGRYQFLGSTWDSIAKRYGLPDFRPIHQDMGAVALAREHYEAETGRDLSEDLASRDPQRLAQIGRILSAKWTSLPSGIEEGQGEDKFVSTFMKLMDGEVSNASLSARMHEAAAQAGVSAAEWLVDPSLPDPMDDPDYAPGGEAIPDDPALAALTDHVYSRTRPSLDGSAPTAPSVSPRPVARTPDAKGAPRSPYTRERSPLASMILDGTLKM